MSAVPPALSLQNFKASFTWTVGHMDFLEFSSKIAADVEWSLAVLSNLVVTSLQLGQRKAV